MPQPAPAAGVNEARMTTLLVLRVIAQCDLATVENITASSAGEDDCKLLVELTLKLWWTLQTIRANVLLNPCSLIFFWWSLIPAYSIFTHAPI